MSLKVVAAMLNNTLNHSLEDLTAEEASDKALDVIETAELSTAPAEVMKASADMDAMVTAVGALQQLQAIGPMEDTTIVDLSKNALSTTLPTTDETVSMENISVYLKHVIRQIKEIIKRLFLMIARSLGLFRLRVTAALSELEHASRLLKVHFTKNKRIMIHVDFTAEEMRWFLFKDHTKSGNGAWGIEPDIVAKLEKQVTEWDGRRKLAADTVLSVARNVVSARSLDEMDTYMRRLIGASFAENEKEVTRDTFSGLRNLTSLPGGNAIINDHNGETFILKTADDVPAVSGQRIPMDNSALEKYIHGLITAGSVLVRLEHESEDSNSKLESYFYTIANRAEVLNDRDIKYALTRLKTAAVELFRCDSAVIDAYIHVAKIFCRKARDLK